MLRAMRLADRLSSPVLGVNLGKLGFLAEVDVPDLASALSAIDAHEFTTEPRLAVDAVIAGQVITAFNDIAFVRFPGPEDRFYRGPGRRATVSSAMPPTRSWWRHRPARPLTASRRAAPS